MKTMGGTNIKDILDYCLKYFVKATSKGTYMVLLMYYAYKQDEVPGWAKRIILGSIAYVLSPIDAIPDLTPFIGMTDDVAVLTVGLLTILSYIDDEVRHKARAKLKNLASHIPDSVIDDVDAML